MRQKKSKFRIVPATHPKFGSCWSLKEGEFVIGTFVNRQAAETRKLQLEKSNLENFLLVKTANQELKIEE